MTKKTRTSLKYTIAVIGLGLIIWKTSILVATGIYLLMWSNNIDYVKRE
jgi:hypothetical protein